MNGTRECKLSRELYRTYLNQKAVFNVQLSQSSSAPERYLHTRVIGACEAIDVQKLLGFNQFHL